MIHITLQMPLNVAKALIGIRQLRQHVTSKDFRRILQGIQAMEFQNNNILLLLIKKIIKRTYRKLILTQDHLLYMEVFIHGPIQLVDVRAEF